MTAGAAAMTSPGFLADVMSILRGAGVDLGALGLAWARVLPTVTLIPAFGLRALAMPARAALSPRFTTCSS